MLSNIKYHHLGIPTKEKRDNEVYLEKYKTYPEDLINKCGLYILSSTFSYDDIKKAQQYPFVSEFISKPLTMNKLNEIKKNKLH